MDRLELGPVTAMRAPQFSYVRIDANGMLTPQALGQALCDGRMGQFLATSGKRAALLNAAGMHRFGTEDVDFIATQWAPLLASIQIRRLSVVVSEQVFGLFGQVFQHGAKRAASSGVDVRCFPSAQFNSSWESVTWLDAPDAAPPGPPAAAPAPAPGGLMRMPKLVDSAAWNRADVQGIAFLQPQGGPPGLGFIFRDAGVALSIFDAWHRDLGPRDDGELLRVAIIEGDRPGRPPGYVVTLQPDIEAIVARAVASGGLDVDMSAMDGWAKSMNTPPGGSPHLQNFKQVYAQRGEYALVPVVMNGQDIEPLYGKQLVKRRLHLRQARDITDPRDPDGFVVR